MLLIYYHLKISIPILLNGKYLGVCTDPTQFVKLVIKMRIKGLLPFDLSVSYNIIDDEIIILSDSGRFIRPLLKVKDGKLELNALMNKGWEQLLQSAFLWVKSI